MADTGFKSPSATGDDYFQWANATNGYSSDNAYTWVEILGEQQDYYNFNFGVPAGATINGVEVTVEGYAGGTEIINGDKAGIKVDLSNNGGTSYGTKINKYFLIAYGDHTQTYGGATSGDSYWGLTLTDTSFSNTNFRVRVEYDSGGGGVLDFNMDHIQVKVYYTAAGSSTVRLFTLTGVGT